MLSKQHEAISQIQDVMKIDATTLLVNCLPDVVVLTFPSYCEHLHGKKMESEDELMLHCLQDYQNFVTQPVSLHYGSETQV